MSIKHALLSGLAARLYVAVLNFVSVPILLRWLGIEAMGLIGLMATIQALFAIVDAAVASVVTSHAGATLPETGRARATSLAALRGAERVYWLSTPAVLVLSFLAAALFLVGWSDDTTLGVREAAISLALLALSATLLWPTSYYGAVLFGLGRHGTVGLVTSVTWTARIAGGLGLLFVFEMRPSVFFAWQAITTFLGVLALRWAVRRAVPDWKAVRGSVRGAIRTLGASIASVSAVAAAGLVFNQMDKLIVGQLFSLETFGYYSLAWQLAGALYLIYSPVFNAFLPAISRAQAVGHRALTSRLTTDAMAVMGLLVLPLAAAVGFVSDSILFAWTGDAKTAEGTALFLKLAFTGAAANALLFVPFAVQMATSSTTITLRAVIGSIVVGLPLMLVGSAQFGVAGAVAVWAAASIVQLGVVLYLTVTTVLKVPVGGWIWRNLGAIASPALVAMAALLPFAPTDLTRSGSGALVIGAFVLCYAVTFLLNWRTVTSVLAGPSLRGVHETRAAHDPSS